LRARTGQLFRRENPDTMCWQASLMAMVDCGVENVYRDRRAYPRGLFFIPMA